MGAAKSAARVASWRIACSTKRAGAEALHEGDAAAREEHGDERVNLGARVEEGQHDEMTIGGADPHRLGHDLAAEEVVGVGEEHALGLGGRARGVLHGDLVERRDLCPGWVSGGVDGRPLRSGSSGRASITPVRAGQRAATA